MPNLTAELASPPTLLECSNISKYYGKVAALEDVSLQLYDGEILGLVGDNGAGKSTLIKIIRGVVRPDSGSISVGGVQQQFRSPIDAIHAGIQCVYQEATVVEQLSLAENFFLGQEPEKQYLAGLIRLVDFDLMRQHAATALSELGFELDVSLKVSEFSGGERQATAVARALYFSPRILLLDEPTSALSEKAKTVLYQLLLSLKGRVGMILVSHDLDAALSVSDRIVILKHGRVVRSLATSEGLDRRDVLAHM
jgi:ABC-type sugar transport system ATPase subunit